MISVRRARVLPLPSFRFRLATDTLGFGYDLPAAGRSWDFHPLERALAGRTEKTVCILPVQTAFHGFQPYQTDAHIRFSFKTMI